MEGVLSHHGHKSKKGYYGGKFADGSMKTRMSRGGIIDVLLRASPS
jgi:hypothetical protein